MKTIGTRLKEARESRQLTLEKVAVATHIRLRFLKALEEDDFSTMPSAAQARGFLRNYADFLGLDLDVIIAEMHQEEAIREAEHGVVFEGDPSQASQVENGPVTSIVVPESGTQKMPFWGKWINRIIRPPAPEMDPGEARESSGMHSPTPVDTPTQEDIPIHENAGSQSTPDSQMLKQQPLNEPDPDQESPAQEPASPEGLREEKTEDESDAGEPGPPHLTGQSYWDVFVAWIQSVSKRRTQKALPDYEADIDQTEQLEEVRVTPRSADVGPTSREILDEIGDQLRERREMLSLTLEEIERHTHLRAQFLRALEAGDFDELPSTVQTRGMLNNYAQFLDLDVDSILLRFADALQVRHRERYPQKPTGRRGQPIIPASIPKLRSFIAGDLMFGLGMMILLVGFAIWGIASVVSLQSKQADPDSEISNPSISEALIGTPVEAVETEVTLIPAADTPIPGLPEGTLDIATPLENVAVQINIVVVERTYLLVRVDGEVQFDGRALPGNAYPFEAEESIDIVAGNAAALRVVYNQRDLGLMGGFGELVNFVFTAEEILTPTQVPTPTPTFTPPVTPTPSPTQSATPTLPAEAGIQ
jgi:cytoskeleton protein RodZ